MINMDVYSTRVVIRSQVPLTVGLVGGQVHFRFSDHWKKLTKTVVFRQGEITKDVVGVTAGAVIPWEVLQIPGMPVEIGVYGSDDTGKVIIPTMWAKTDPVLEGADPMVDASTKATLPVYQQIQAQVEKNTVREIAIYDDTEGNFTANRSFSEICSSYYEGGKKAWVAIYQSMRLPLVKLSSDCAYFGNVLKDTTYLVAISENAVTMHTWQGASSDAVNELSKTVTAQDQELQEQAGLIDGHTTMLNQLRGADQSIQTQLDTQEAAVSELEKTARQQSIQLNALQNALNGHGDRLDQLDEKKPVLFTEQELTDGEKAQARENIGAVSDGLFKITGGNGAEVVELTNVIGDASIFTAGKFCSHTSGKILDNENYYCTEELIPFPAKGRLFTYFSENATTAAYPVVVFYDAEKNYISGMGSAGLSEKTEFEGMSGAFYAVPTDTRYIRVSVMKSYFRFVPSSLFLYIATTKNEPMSVEILGLVTQKSVIDGKNVVFFGDSIFGMHRDETSVSSCFAEATGANVYNVGFGGCRMSVHPSTGYGAFSMWALADAIYNDNWATQEAEATSGSSYFQEQLNVLKSIDFSTVDIAVIHYGTNDFTGNISIDNDENPLDYATLCGALRYSIEKLLAKYPHLRIYISVPTFRYWENDEEIYPDTHANKNGKYMIDFVKALQETGMEYCIPVINSFHRLGVNKLNATTFLADGTHHNEVGRKRLGYFIASQICSNV